MLIALILSIGCLVAPDAAYSRKDDKVVEKSGRRPSWIGNMTPGAFAVSALGNDLSQAQTKCLSDIKQHIAGAVATNIVSIETNYNLSERTDGDEVLYSKYTSNITSAAAKLPFISGITLSNALETYWEKHYVRSTGKYYYEYHVLYPFTSSELDNLVARFHFYDKDMYGKLKTLEDDYKNIRTLADINDGIMRLEPLMVYFFDDYRKAEAEALHDAYMRAASEIKVVPLSSTPESFEYVLELNGNVMDIKQLPELSSQTLSSLSVSVSDQGRFTVRFSADSCSPRDDNGISITHRFANAIVKYRHTVNVPPGPGFIIPCGFVSFRHVCGEEHAKVLMKIRTRAYDQVHISEIVFDISSFEALCPNEPFVLRGEGDHSLSFDMGCKGSIALPSNGMLGGYIVAQGKRIDFTLPYVLEDIVE